MDGKLCITKRKPQRGEDGHRVISIRMKDELIQQLDALSEETKRSRNELVNLILESALKMVVIHDEY